MKCEQAKPLIDAYLDGELELTACVEMEEHLAGCESCRKALEERQALTLAVREEMPRFEAPPFLATRIRASLRAEEEAKEEADSNSFMGVVREIVLWAKRRQSAVATAFGALALGAVVVFSLDNGSDRGLAEEAITDHVRSLQASHLMDVASTDQHTVKPWFAGKIDFAPPVIQLDSQGYPLVGGRLDVLDHRTVAALVYQRRKHFINLFIWPVNKSDRLTKFHEEDGYRVYGWTNAGMNYLAVSEIGRDELMEFAGMIQTKTGMVKE